MKINKSIRNLDLSTNDIETSDFEYLCNALEKNKSIVDLRLVHSLYNQGADLSMFFISKMLIANQSLLSLNLFGNMMRSEGLSRLEIAMKENKTLKTLNLGSSYFSRNDCTEFVNSMLLSNETLLELKLPVSDVEKLNKRNKNIYEINRFKNLINIKTKNLNFQFI